MSTIRDPEILRLDTPKGATSTTLAPLVIVEGFLSSTSTLLWGDFQAHLNARSETKRPVIFASYVESSIVKLLQMHM